MILGIGDMVPQQASTQLAANCPACKESFLCIESERCSLKSMNAAKCFFVVFSSPSGQHKNIFEKVA